jgi:tetratricopeptide (TPR) repeat protein
MAWLIAGCGGAAPPRPSETQEAALAWNERGRVAYVRGDFTQALSNYREALALNRAVEDVDGMARELVNLATVYRRLGERAKANAALEEILAPGGIPFSAAQRAEATYHLALHAAEDGDAARARSLAVQAAALCSGCAAEGAIGNFLAGFRLGAGDAVGAREQARRALEINRRLGDKAEEANSQRLLADAALRLKDIVAAAAAYQEALTLDKALGQPHKIAADLLGLGEVALAQGRGREAVDYFQRARAVAEVAGLEALRRQAEARRRAANP